jgi:hypothetical protein
MARFRTPFFRAPRDLWYVQLDGHQINLGPDKDAAFTRWHELTAAPKAAPPLPAERLVLVVVDDFLGWCQQHRAPDTYYMVSTAKIAKSLWQDKSGKIGDQMALSTLPGLPVSPSATADPKNELTMIEDTGLPEIPVVTVNARKTAMERYGQSAMKKVLPAVS